MKIWGAVLDADNQPNISVEYFHPLHKRCLEEHQREIREATAVDMAAKKAERN